MLKLLYDKLERFFRREDEWKRTALMMMDDGLKVGLNKVSLYIPLLEALQKLETLTPLDNK